MRSQRDMALAGVLAVITAAGRLEAQSTPVGLAGTPQEIAAHWFEQGTCTAASDDRDPQPVVLFASAFRFGYEVSCLAGEDGDLIASAPASSAPAMFAAASSADIRVPDAFAAEFGVDTISYFFQTDRSTPRTDDFVLMRQVGGRRPEPAVRNVLAYPGRPFFQYYYRKTEGGRRSTLPAPASWLPLQHAAVKHGTPADTGATARIDTLLAVEINYAITNGRIGAAEQIDLVSVPIAVASLGLKKKRGRPCEKDESMFSQAAFVESCS